MQTYDPNRRPQYRNPIPAMRPARERTGGQSATPIYDALYAEYRRSFRALPGDRSGEEELGFQAFGGLTGFATGRYDTEGRGSAFAGAIRFGAGRHAARQLTSGPTTGSSSSPSETHQSERSGPYQSPVWQPVTRQHGPGELRPVALPPPQRHER